ncbi:hypothetical protein BJ742DRAFT_893630 [Cladochytrium replicatum]|nr:hypothetical protein BJ742DRAFT_893630 [Cladochytrium replicatum]
MRSLLPIVALLNFVLPSFAAPAGVSRFFQRTLSAREGSPEVLPLPNSLLDSINAIRSPQEPITVDSAHTEVALKHAVDQAQNCIASGGFPYWLDGDSYLLVTNIVKTDVLRDGETGHAVVIPDLSTLRSASVYWPNFNSTSIERTSIAFARNEACDKEAGKTTLFFSLVVGPCPGPARAPGRESDLCL